MLENKQLLLQIKPTAVECTMLVLRKSTAVITKAGVKLLNLCCRHHYDYLKCHKPATV